MMADCGACGAKDAIQGQGPECIPGLCRRSYNQCTACGNVSDVKVHPCNDKDCKAHGSA